MKHLACVSITGGALSAYTYLVSLAVISAVVAAAERFFPLRPQRQLRRALWSDVVHLVFNAHFLGVILFGIAANRVLPVVDAWLADTGRVGFATMVGRNVAASWPLAVQIVVALVVVDFLQWCVHNLLHRVPFLWPLHQTHHSVTDGEMDWIVSFRFQWAEVVVYKSLLYVPLAFFGFSSEAMLVHAIFGTLIGHLNHANLDLGHGWWRYVLNSPRMHIWHHDRDGDLKSTVNFGIIFSTWDWLFGTAKMPDAPPAHIGFVGDEKFPTDFFGQAAWPLPKLLGGALTTLPGRVVSSTTGVAVVAGLAFLSMPPAPETPLLGEPAASSQPASTARFAYARSVEEADGALARFGDNARAVGFAHPEHMVSVRELAAALTSERLAILDVRPRDRFVVGHVPGAQRVWRDDYSTGKRDPIPGLSRDRAALAALLAARGVSPDDVVVLMGDGGPEPYRLWWTLTRALDVDVRVLEGGLGAWKREGHGLAEGEGRSITATDARAFLPADDPFPASTTWSEVAPRVELGAALIDTRSLDEFTGDEQHSESVRAGHVDGAAHLEWVHVMEDDEAPRLRDPASLRALFETHGLSDVVAGDRDVVLMCQSGTRSAVVLFALHQVGAPAKHLANHDGSFAEVSRLDVPLVRGQGESK